jgi:small subunit ribosomal protein S4
MQTMLKNITSQIKMIIGMPEEKGQVLSERLVKKLIRLGLIGAGTSLTEAMNLTLQNLLNRRLQTLVFKKEMAKSMKQARQFITHEHILVGGKKVTAPGYIVPIAEESSIAYVENSALFNPDHPERALPEKAPAPIKAEDGDKKEDKEDKEKKEVKKEEVAEKKADAVPKDAKTEAPVEVKA